MLRVGIFSNIRSIFFEPESSPPGPFPTIGAREEGRVGDGMVRTDGGGGKQGFRTAGVGLAVPFQRGRDMRELQKRFSVRRLLLILLAAVLFSFIVPAKTAAADEEIQWRRKNRIEDARAVGGLEFEQYYFKELFGRPQMVSILRGGRRTRYGIGVCEDGKRETVSALAKKYDARAAVNAGFFTFDAASRPAGMLKAAGVVYNDSREGATNRGYFALTPQGEARILAPGEVKLDELDSIVYGNDLLLKSGRITASDAPDRHPRTAVGIDEDGAVILLVVDGRNEKSAGVTLRELAAIMKSLGCRDALNLDGGGSSAMYWRGAGIVSYPSDNKKFDHAGERRVHNILYCH